MTTDWSLPLDVEEDSALGLPCPHCGRPNPGEAAFCYFDGAPLQGQPPPLRHSGIELVPISQYHPAAPTEEITKQETPFPLGTPARPPGVPKTLLEGRQPPSKIHPPPLPDPLADLRAACVAKPPDWNLINFLAAEARAQGQVLPPLMQTLETEAKQRWNCFQRLNQALEKNKLLEIVSAYNPVLLDDWPACAEQVARARQARACGTVLREVQALVNNPKAGQTLLSAWSKHARQLAPWAESEPIKQAVRSWEGRQKAWENLRHFLEASPVSDRAIAQAWAKLQEVGGHPEALAAPVQQRAQLAAQRIACLDRLPPQAPIDSEDSDALLVQSWNAALLKDCPEAQWHQDRHAQAVQRLRVVEELAKLVAQVDQGLAGEEAIPPLAATLPAGYQHRQVQRVAQARERVEVRTQLRRALGTGRPSDKDIAAWFDRAKAARLRMDRQQIGRCQLAEKRRARLEQLSRLDGNQPLDRQDQQRLKLWDDKLFENCADADTCLPAVQESRARVQAWRALEKALKAKDLAQIEALANHPLLVGYPPVGKAMTAVQDLVQQAQFLGRIKEAMAQGEAAGFVDKIDLNYLRAHHELLAPHQRAIEELLERWLRDTPTITKTNPLCTPDPLTGLVVVHWTWKYFGRVSHCKVAVSPLRFFKSPEETGGQTMHWDVEAHRRAGGGIAVPGFPGNRQLYVTVWPAIDLGEGWQEVIGPPLHLGPMKVPGPPRS